MAEGITPHCRLVLDSLPVTMRYTMSDRMNISVVTVDDIVQQQRSSLQKHQWFRDYTSASSGRGSEVSTAVSIMVDKYICAGARIFCGTKGSSFSVDILKVRRREGWASGFDGFVLPKKKDTGTQGAMTVE